MNLDDPIVKLVGVGPKMAEKLERLGIKTIRDLLFYYPRRYDDFTHPRSISGLRIDEDVIIKARVMQIKQSRTRRKWMSIIEALLVDDTGQIKAVWFNQPFLINILKPGTEWYFAGKIGWDFKNKTKNINVTQYENVTTEQKILPIYPETEGLTSKYLRKLIKEILFNQNDTSEVSSVYIEEYMPEKILKSEKLIGINDAIKNIHFPNKIDDIKIARKRLAFDELFMISLKIVTNKKELLKSRAVALRIDNDMLKKFVKTLPFKLTNAQRKTAWEIICDLKKSTPMNRLLEGDVGSGKTVVAVLAALAVSKSGYQTVWLAPTEILTNQHYENISKMLKPFGLNVGLWTGANKKSDLKKDDIILGTHALIQKNISFERLGLIIVDEQHRFGVKQRAELRIQNSELNFVPHFLSMTATPIPRTLALTFYGDLDLSIIDEMPKGRQEIITKIVTPENRQKAYQFIESQIKSGKQVFVICPLIEAKESLKINLFETDRKSVMEEYKKLSQDIFPKYNIGLMHGKMKSTEKGNVMDKFKKGKIDILVSTAVIEVGIDIQNATVMMIESAERFGLAQLHQFRGRVGRGKHQSYCFLFSENQTEINKKRLQAMVDCNNGFDLAQIDLDLRGPGEISGIKQSGVPDLKMATLTDRIMIESARFAASKVIDEGIKKYQKLQEKFQDFLNIKYLE